MEQLKNDYEKKLEDMRSQHEKEIEWWNQKEK